MNLKAAGMMEYMSDNTMSAVAELPSSVRARFGSAVGRGLIVADRSESLERLARESARALAEVKKILSKGD